MSVSTAIIGNSRLHIGMALAGDLALRGHDVRFAPWPDQLDLLDLIRDAGGVTVSAPAGDTLSGNTPNAGRFAEALDAERPAVCEAYGVRFRSLLEHIHRLYGGSGDTVYEAVQQSPVYKNTGARPSSIWLAWAEADVPLAHVPFTELAESAGLQAPRHRGFVNIVDCLLGMNSWQDGLNLERLGLAGMGSELVGEFLTTGEPAI